MFYPCVAFHHRTDGKTGRGKRPSTFKASACAPPRLKFMLRKHTLKSMCTEASMRQIAKMADSAPPKQKGATQTEQVLRAKASTKHTDSLIGQGVNTGENLALQKLQ